MSLSVIGNLRVNMGMDTAAFLAGVKQTQTALVGMQKSIAKFNTAANAVMTGFGLNIIGTAVVDALRQVAQIGDLAETVGMTAEQIQVFNRMALASGSSAESMAKGLQEIAEQSTNANSNLSKLFAANNLQVQGRATIDVVRDFMDLLRNAKTPTEQLAMATSVLGTRVGRDLVEAMRSGAQGVEDAYADMEKSGAYHTDEEVKRIQKIEEEYNRVAAAIAVRWQQMIISLVDGAGNFVLGIDPLINPDFSKPTAAGELFRYLTGGKTDPNFGKTRLPDNVAMPEQGRDLFYKPPAVNMGPMGGPGQFSKATSILPKEQDIKKTEAAIARLQSLADKWRAAIMTPIDEYKAQIAELQQLRDKGLLTQEEYLKAVAKAQEDYGAGVKQMGDAIRASVQTPLDEYNARLEELKRALDLGAISQETFNKAVEQAGWSLLDATSKAPLSDQMDGAANSIEDLQQRLFNFRSEGENIIGDLSAGLEDVFVQFATTGKLSFEDFIDSMIADLARFAYKLAMSGLLDFLSGKNSGGNSVNLLSSVIGGIMGGAGVATAPGLYAAGGVFKNGIVSNPTAFSYGRGKMGIMGEAGPEAIMPLRRGPDGKLGVMAANGNSAPVIVKHTVLNYGGAKIEQQERTGANGERELLTIIDRRMASQMSDPYSPASSALDARGARIAKKRR